MFEIINERKRLSLKDARELYYPNYILFTHCSIENDTVKDGIVVAIGNRGEEGYKKLLDLQMQLSQHDEENGIVHTYISKKPYEGEDVFIEEVY